MSTKKLRVIGDLVFHGRNLLIRCKCGRESVIAPFELGQWASAHKWPETIADVVPKLRCADCGEPGAAWGTTAEPANITFREIARRKAAAALKEAMRYIELMR